MIFTNYLKNVFLLFLWMLSATTQANIIQKKCGPNFFIVNIIDPNDDSLRKFELYSKPLKGKKTLFYTSRSGEHIFSSCVKSKNNEYLMLFQEIQGLDANPNDTYGIFNPEKDELVINPHDWPQGNQKEVKQLLGYHPPFVKGMGPFFCCFQSDYRQRDYETTK